jgi:hypothetical protein
VMFLWDVVCFCVVFVDVGCLCVVFMVRCLFLCCFYATLVVFVLFSAFDKNQLSGILSFIILCTSALPMTSCMQSSGYLQLFQGMITYESEVTAGDMISNIASSNGSAFNDQRLLTTASSSLIRFAAKGKLGSSLLVWDGKGKSAYPDNFGSVHFKLDTGKSMLSIIVFPKAKKIKVSGGFPKYANITNIADKEGTDPGTVIDWYLKDVHEIVSKFVVGNIETKFRIGMINAGYDSGKHITPIECFPLFASRFFHKVFAHEPELGGRRFAVKMYIKEGRTLNIACDHFGRVQIFSAHTFDEIIDAIDSFERMLSVASLYGINIFQR